MMNKNRQLKRLGTILLWLVPMVLVVKFSVMSDPALVNGFWNKRVHFSRVYLPLVYNGNIAPFPTSIPTSRPTNTKTPIPTSQPNTTQTPVPGNLIFSDEFNSQIVDLTKWTTMYPWGRSLPENGELEYYADDGFDFTATTIKLKAEKRSMMGYSYTSGMISSHGKFHLKYGYIEMRARLPEGKGLWPAFWMVAVSDDWPPEVDIFEVLGQEPVTVYMTNWYGSNSNPVNTQFSYTGPDTSASFHTYAIDWQIDRITWYIDGVQRAEVTENVSAQEMFLIANLAVGGDWPGAPDSTTVFPAFYEIDYIRVYASKP